MKKLLAAIGTILSAGLVWFASTLVKKGEASPVDRSPASVVVALQYQKERIQNLEQEQIRFREEYLADFREVKGDIKELLQRTPRRSEVGSVRRSKKEEPN